MASSTRWADGPWQLIETPSATKNISKHPAHYVANEMAFAHTAMVRGLNCIYLQAPHVPAGTTEASDLCFFIASWADWIHHHHDLEELHLFPDLESIPGVSTGTLQRNVDQHQAFSGGLEALSTYAKETPAEAYSGKHVCELIEGFAEPFREHLADEIDTLWALESVGKEHEQKILQAWRKLEGNARKQDKFVVPPMVMGLSDKTFQGGNDWPVLPWGAEYIVHYLLGNRHAGAWKFLPSDPWRMPRSLLFLGKNEEE